MESLLIIGRKIAVYSELSKSSHTTNKKLLLPGTNQNQRWLKNQY